MVVLRVALGFVVSVVIVFAPGWIAAQPAHTLQAGQQIYLPLMTTVHPLVGVWEYHDRQAYQAQTVDIIQTSDSLVIEEHWYCVRHYGCTTYHGTIPLTQAQGAVVELTLEGRRIIPEGEEVFTETQRLELMTPTDMTLMRYSNQSYPFTRCPACNSQIVPAP